MQQTPRQRFTQPEPAWSNPMFNTLGGRNLLVRRAYGTGAGLGQETTPMPAGYYRPGSEYNWYSYTANDPVNGSDVTGYWDPWLKVAGAFAVGVGVAAMLAGGAATVVGWVPGLAVGEVNLLVSVWVFTVGVALTDWGAVQLSEGRWPGLPPVLSPPWF